MKRDFSRLEREMQPMPEFVKEELEDRGVMEDYWRRPAYQQNDYLLWINSAKQQRTKEKRLRQMVDELERGGDAH